MPWGLIFIGFCAVFLCMNRRPFPLPADTTLLLSLLPVILILSFIDIRAGSGSISPGSVILLLSCLALSIWGKGVSFPRQLICGISIGTLLFLLNSGIIWQIEQYLPPELPLALICGAVIAALAGGHAEAVIASGIGSTLAALVKLILLNGETGVETLDTFGKIAASACFLRWLADYFKRRQLTNDR